MVGRSEARGDGMGWGGVRWGEATAGWAWTQSFKFPVPRTESLDTKLDGYFQSKYKK